MHAEGTGRDAQGRGCGSVCYAVMLTCKVLAVASRATATQDVHDPMVTRCACPRGCSTAKTDHSAPPPNRPRATAPSPPAPLPCSAPRAALAPPHAMATTYE